MKRKEKTMQRAILKSSILAVVASASISLLAGILPASAQGAKGKIIHDSEYYILDAEMTEYNPTSQRISNELGKDLDS